MTIHPLTVKALRKILEHDTGEQTRETCKDNNYIVVVEKNSHPCDTPLGTVVDITFNRDEPVKIVIERTSP